MLSRPEVHVSVKGLRDVPRFKKVAGALRDRDTLSKAELQAMKKHGARMRAVTEADAASKL